MKKLLLAGLCALALVSLTGCGQKGPLVPPPAAAYSPL
ncbi:MAG: LPS translocon maturation chaperone LptM [Pseudohongiellaceae bacterium]